MAGNDVLGVGWTQVHGQGFLSTLGSVKGRVEGHSFPAHHGDADV